jgi:hypothetical protein
MQQISSQKGGQKANESRGTADNIGTIAAKGRFISFDIVINTTRIWTSRERRSCNLPSRSANLQNGSVKM